MLEPSICNPPFIITKPVLSPTAAGSIINVDGPFNWPVNVIFLIPVISLLLSNTTAFDAAAVPAVISSIFSKSASFILAEPITKEPPVIVPVVVIVEFPTSIEPKPLVILPPSNAPTLVIFVCVAVVNVPAIFVNVPAAAEVAPIVVPSIAPPFIFTAPNVPTLVIFGCAGVANVPVILVLAVNVVNVPSAAVAAPIVVPSIAPPFIFAFGISVSPVNVTFPLIKLIKSVSSVCPIFVPSIFILSTVNDVNVPTLVIADCAAFVIVAAEPLTLPFTFPVKLPVISPVTLPITSPVNPPTNAVDVIDVAFVITPSSTLIVESKTIAEPVGGLILTSPDDDDIVFPFKFKLSTCKVVKVPTDVIAAWEAPVTVAAVPDTLPVTLPVKFPVTLVVVKTPVDGL